MQRDNIEGSGQGLLEWRAQVDERLGLRQLERIAISQKEPDGSMYLTRTSLRTSFALLFHWYRRQIIFFVWLIATVTIPLLDLPRDCRPSSPVSHDAFKRVCVDHLWVH